MCYKIRVFFAPVAQSVEQLPLKQTVVGSIPTGCTHSLIRVHAKNRRNAPVFCVGAESGNRTHTVLRPGDFKSPASTNFAISANLQTK